jgi:hypothetical protein
MTRRRAWAPAVMGATLGLVMLAGCTTPSDRSASPPPPSSATSSPASPPPLPTVEPEVTLTPAPRCPKAPTWPGGATAFGTHVSTRDLWFADKLAELDSTFGRLDAVRVFEPSVPPANTWERRGALVEGRVVVHSFRVAPAEVLAGAHDEALRHYFTTVPGDIQLFWSYFHEVEPHIEAGQFTAAEYRRAFRRIADIAHEQCRTDLYPTLILTGYALEPSSGRDWRDYYPGDDYISVLGWDPYNSASRPPTEYAQPEELFGRVVAVSRAAGKPFGIAETGSRLLRSDPSGRGRAAWLRRTAAYLEKQGAVFVTYYHSIGVSGADYRLQDAPSIRAWRSWVTRP